MIERVIGGKWEQIDRSIGAYVNKCEIYRLSAFPNKHNTQMRVVTAFEKTEMTMMIQSEEITHQKSIDMCSLLQLKWNENEKNFQFWISHKLRDQRAECKQTWSVFYCLIFNRHSTRRHFNRIIFKWMKCNFCC